MGDFNGFWDDYMYGRLPRAPAPSTGGNSVTAGRDVARAPAEPRAPAAAPAETEKVEPKGVLSFLRDYRSLDEIYRNFPELSTVALPASIDDDAAKAFAQMLRSVLGRERAEALVRAHAPADIMRSLAELRARRGGGEAAPKQSSGNPAPRSERRTDVADRKQPRRVTLPHLLMNRQTAVDRRGSEDRLRRLVGAGRDKAHLAQSLRCNKEKLKTRYGKLIAPLRDAVNDTYPNRLRLIEEDLSPDLAAEACVLPLARLLGSKLETMEFFQLLFELECTVRILPVVLENGAFKVDVTASTAANVVRRRFEYRRDAILSAVWKEVQSGLLRFERAEDHLKCRSTFEKILIDSLIALADTGDIDKATAKFREARTQLLWNRPSNNKVRCAQSLPFSTRARIRYLNANPGKLAESDLLATIAFEAYLYTDNGTAAKIVSILESILADPRGPFRRQ